MKERLLAAYFVDGLDVGDPDTLVAVAADAGLDGDAVRPPTSTATRVSREVAEALTSAADTGITAVPTYVIDGRWSMPGAQDPAVFVQVLRRLAARAAVLSGCTPRPRQRAGDSCSSTASPRRADHGRRSAGALAERFEVVTVDAPGHGGSARIDAGLDAGAELLGDDVRAGHLRRLLDGRPPLPPPRPCPSGARRPARPGRRDGRHRR